MFGNTAKPANEIAAAHKKARLVEEGEACGKLTDLVFHDPGNFNAGELHDNYMYWEEISHRTPSSKQEEILGWIRDKVSIAPYFRHFKGDFKGSFYDSDKPPARMFKNKPSCKFFSQFVQKTLINRVKWCNLHSRESRCGLCAAHCSAFDSRAHKAKTLSQRAFLKSMDV